MACGSETAEPPRPGVEVLTARSVPLGGPRAMTVRRTLPQRARTLIGAWCFADHYGPDDVSLTGGMDVAPHPHTGLQTVSWLFSGEIEHRDSLGSHAFVRPGELNLMTGGHGISHSEVSTPRTTLLHGVQLWVALPEEHRGAARDFQHHVPQAVSLDGGEARVFLGSLAGATSPVRTFTPLLGAELSLAPGATVVLDVDAGFEHGVLVDAGDIRFDGTALRPTELGYAAPGRTTLTLVNDAAGPARLVLLGGPPFGEEIVMWWNFIGRTHDDIVEAREAWQNASDRFGAVEGYDGGRLPAPALPNATIRPRRNPATPAPHTAGSAPDSAVEPAVVHVPERNRYEIHVGDTSAGLTAYRDRDEQRVFHHTKIEDAYGGRGLAARLVHDALEDVRASGKRIVPVCPYVKKYLAKHEGYADITDPVTPEVLRWLVTRPT
ncbi:bifunctional pirin family protein/GNAT family N-acetyltransferase [Streptomyces thermolilacinus]|uniref:bifunctional pirin family protein/GNAT family N-acetyltransferase n=1 Tax=Streptomyces thermolilacinus TaxID=285540 RepID=UPI0004906039